MPIAQTVFRAVLILLGTAACATVRVGESHFFIPGPAATAGPVVVAGAEVTDVTLQAADGTTLGGAYVARAGADVDILYFGGNASHVDDTLPWIGTAIGKLNANVLMVDYRGYGRSAGTPAIESLKQDALAAFDFLRARDARRPIVVHGFSLGSFIAAYVAANRPVQGVVLEGPAPDVATWAKHQVPLYAKAVVRVEIAPALLRESNLTAVAQSTAPLLLLTGSRDPVTPPKFLAPILAASASTNKRSFVANGASHGNALTVAAAMEAYRQLLDAAR
jgi:uncharacterized protein